MKCDICGKEFKTKQALNSHIGWHNKPNRDSNFLNYNEKLKSGELIKTNSNQFIKAKNNGLNIKTSDYTKQKISKSLTGKTLSKEHKDNISKAMKLAVKKYPDSYSKKNVSGRVKSITYKNTIVKGTWELTFVKWLDENNISWTNSISGITYVWEESEHTYFPDFYLPELNYYVEVKGYQRDRDLYKWAAVDNLIIIKKKEIQLIKKGIFNLGLII